MPHIRSRLIAARAVTACLIIGLLTNAAFAQRGGVGGGGGGGATPVTPPRFQWVGPDFGGRISAVSGVAGDTMTYYFGAASGGIWKTTDGARTFSPIFDDQPVQAIGALAVAPSNARTIYAGTGEAWAIRDADVMGDGIYKSTDAGATWTNIGLKETGRIGKIIVHPTNPNIVYVCALGRATGPQQERGVYRTKDGGTTWQRVLFVNENTGCSGLSIDVSDPKTLFAASWEVVMHTYAMFSGGNSSGIYVSHDSGSTWKRVEAPGLPHLPLGKIDVAVAPSNSKRVYALIQTPDQGSMWRSDDGGEQWKVVSWDRTLIGRAGYYINVEVNPQNDLEVLVANSSFHRSLNGGETFPITDRGCGDCHDIWMDPRNPAHWAETGDIGAGITRNHGQTFNQFTLPIGQMYHVAIDDQVPYWIYSNRQDNGTMRGPSNAPVPSGNINWPNAVAGAGGRAGGAGGGGGRGGGGGGGRGAGGGGGAGAAGGNAGAGGAGATGAAGAGAGAAGAGAAGGGGAGGGAGAAGAGAGAGAAGAAGGVAGDVGAPGGAAAPGGGGGAGPAFDPAADGAPPAAGGGRGGRGGQSQWQGNIGGCESGFVLPTPGNPDVVWATCYGNTVTRFDDKIGLARSVSPWIHTLDSSPDKAKYRCHWTAPLAIDPFDPNTVYYGCQVVFKTANAGQSWSVISPDLSTKDSSRIIPSGGIVSDNLGQFYGEVVFAIAPSPVKRGLIWAGTNDGKLWYTDNAGAKWNDVSKNVGMPAWGTIRKIEPSPFDAATAYAVVDVHMMDDRKPYIYKTNDLGKTWKRISDGLPQDHPLAYAMSIAENPNRKGMLVAGTGNAIYYSMDDGDKWTKLNAGLPASPVTWIVFAKSTHDIVVSTYGRGLFVLRDISMMEQADKVIADAAVQIFEPRAGSRLARSGSAELTFALKTAPRDTVKAEFVDSTGTVVRTVKFNGRAGTSRLSWDLRGDGPKQVELRTTPPDNPRIWDEQRFKNRDIRPIAHWGIQAPQRAGPLMNPTQYTLRLTVDGKTYDKKFVVMKDPEISATGSDLAMNSKTQLRIRDNINTTADVVNKIEILRKQIEDLNKADSTSATSKAALKELDKQALDIELQLVSKSDLHSDDKWFVEQYKVYQNLLWLYGEVGTGAGDVAGGAEYRPTDASMNVLAEIEGQLKTATTQFDNFLKVTLPEFNKKMAGKVVPLSTVLPPRINVVP